MLLAQLSEVFYVCVPGNPMIYFAIFHKIKGTDFVEPLSSGQWLTGQAAFNFYQDSQSR